MIWIWVLLCGKHFTHWTISPAPESDVSDGSYDAPGLALRKQAEQATRSKPVSGTHPWPLRQLLSVFLLKIHCYMHNSKLKQAFLSPSCFWSRQSIIAIETLTRTHQWPEIIAGSDPLDSAGSALMGRCCSGWLVTVPGSGTNQGKEAPATSGSALQSQ